MTYHSRQRAPAWARAIGVVVLILAVAAAVVTAVVVVREAPAAASAAAVGVLVGAGVGVVLARAAIVVDVTPGRVELAFPPIFRRVIEAAEIVAVRDTHVSPASFGGTGLRVVPGGRTGLFFRGGPGVEIATSDGRTYSVVVPDPVALRDAVEQVRT